ncbi:DUF411 domain-containing protein [Sphingobium bisphenolivorans]|uniref:DUF411 domain-containing protein n=1 Tax=Sphingobium bisphenolivorans TaxID=1335760 RepID=UPI0003A90251|nr:DUF411 domain-containing protein [Sphingobium bisphenolivorans]
MKRQLIAATVMLLSTAASAATPIIVHRDPGCGCCEKWAAQVQAQFGRRVTMIDDQARGAFQKARGVPTTLVSCHTAVIDGMVFEGHVPITDMKRVLAQRPRGVSGLAVSGMPLGSPGMEVPGQPPQHYVVTAFGAGGTRVFARH